MPNYFYILNVPFSSCIQKIPWMGMWRRDDDEHANLNSPHLTRIWENGMLRSCCEWQTVLYQGQKALRFGIPIRNVPLSTRYILSCFRRNTKVEIWHLYSFQKNKRDRCKTITKGHITWCHHRVPSCHPVMVLSYHVLFTVQSYLFISLKK